MNLQSGSGGGDKADTDVVARWNVDMHDKVHIVEFIHGTTSGKRIIRVDGKEILRREWMFKLVGKEVFEIGSVKCTINVEAHGSFAYEYSLEVNGRTLTRFREEQSKRLLVWEPHLSGQESRIVLDKDTMDVWVNGKKIETAGEFADDGTATHFAAVNHHGMIKSISSGKKKIGMVHQLFIDGQLCPLQWQPSSH